ncbi:DUF3515 domain-containing protein [Streptomyces sp. HMX112]|uniref:DUF3515 domain-containing protein n=1 Tax=Streptomyces sp. HMX112 TaxID=3390850 RepID=UPI003A800671
MTSRLVRLSVLPVAAVGLLLAAAGCSGTGARLSVAAPSPSKEEAAFCRALHEELPRTVAGLDRSDPEPDSDLTAAWGDGAIVLRCGVARPARMSDPKALGIEVNGVDWLLEERAGDGPRFTSTYRKAYVEVSLGERYAHDSGPLVDFADPVRKTVPSSL